jgi:hypothetical protein
LPEYYGNLGRTSIAYSKNDFHKEPRLDIFPPVKSCFYCGRDNENESVHCRECGTEFPAPQASEPQEEEIDAATEEPVSDLSGLNIGFKVVEGFSRPDWKQIYEYVKAHVPKDDKKATYDYIVTCWLDELAGDLGGGARVRHTRNFHCLTDLDAKTSNGLLDYAESVLDTIRACLGKAAWSGYDGRHVLLLFSDPDDYYSYVSYFHRDGTHILSGGMFIRAGYAHVAINYGETTSAKRTLAHELVHNLLCHLPIPLWLNEGLAQVIVRLAGRRGFTLDRDLASRHHDHWNETNIQAFWAGTTFGMPGDDSQLSYSLGEILVTILSEKGPEFIEFIQAADWRDAGLDAAANFLGQGLEDVVAGFLGPGNWRPQRLAIKANLKAESEPKSTPHHPSNPACA